MTILGIVIGITSIMLIVSLGKGAQDLILGEIQGFGSKILAVHPGKQPKGITDMLSTFADSIKQKDLEALKKKSNVPHLGSVMPIVFGTEVAVYENESYRPTILGVNGLFAKLYDIYPEKGRIFSDEDVKSYANVAIIGSKVGDDLFGPNREALDQKIKIKGRNFKVIGILPKKGQSTFFSFDEIILVPYTTAQQYIFGIKYFHRLAIEVDSEENIDQTVEDIKRTLRINHNITDPDKDDFYVETTADAAQMVGTVMSVLTLFLVFVAAISLLVGGVGIMNIMLVSVTERTREIGLRKAIGATHKDILIQFLFESVVLTATGGIIGVIIGICLSFLAVFGLSQATGMNWVYNFPFSAAILGTLVSAFVGIIFGIYPAQKAAKLNPIDALRYE